MLIPRVVARRSLFSTATKSRPKWTASSRSMTQRRFAPLGARDKDSSDPILQGIVFDVDGTLCEPQNYMFGEMRAVLGISKSTDILDHIYSLQGDAQEEAMQAIKNIEKDAMKKQTPQPGLVELMEYLERKGVQKGICTRNFDLPVEHLLEKFLPRQTFHPVITRSFRPPKPDPAGILHIAKSWGLQNEGTDLIMVGDSIDDMTAGRRAGAATVLLCSDANAHLVKHGHTDLAVQRLDDLVGILENGFEGRQV